MVAQPPVGFLELAGATRKVPFTVSNTGNLPLTAISLAVTKSAETTIDSARITIACNSGAVITSLSAGAAMVNCEIIVNFADVADIESGKVVLTGLDVSATAGGSAADVVLTGFAAVKTIAVTRAPSMTVEFVTATVETCTKPTNPGMHTRSRLGFSQHLGPSIAVTTLFADCRCFVCFKHCM